MLSLERAGIGTAVDEEGLPGDVTASGTAEEEGGTDDFFGVCPATDGGEVSELLLLRFVE